MGRRGARPHRPAPRGELVGTEVELDVGPVAHGGHCVARLGGQAVFVRHALPGERVLARVTEQRSSYLRADAVRVLTASGDRVDPPCPHAGPGRCGGCDFQHVAPAAQRRLKADVVADQLRRLAGLDLTVPVLAVPGDVDGLGWRTRVTFAVDRSGTAGLHRYRSHVLEPIDACPLAHPAVAAVGAPSLRWPGVRTVEVESDPAGPPIVVVQPATQAPVELPELDEDVGVALRRRHAVEPVDGPSGHVHHVDGTAMRVRAGGFWQVHPGAAEALVAAVVEGLAPQPGERVLDLYAGAGLFARVLADRVGPEGSVVAVEGDRGGAEDARANLASLGWCRVVHAPVSAGLSVLDEPVDLLVLDPPRTGAGQELAGRLAGLGVRAVAYVACDPAALARDLAVFLAAGWRVARLTGFDLFPMTHHVECVAILERAEG